MKIDIYALHLGVGGVEKYVATVADMLSKYHDVTIISTYKVDTSSSFLINSNVRIEYLIDSAPTPSEFKSALRRLNLIEVLKQGTKNFNLLVQKRKRNITRIKDSKADVVISTRIFHNELISKYMGSALKIATEHNHHNDDNVYISKLIKSVRGFDYLVPISKYLTEFYTPKLEGKSTTCVHIPFYVNMPANTNIQDRNDIVFVGRLEEEKGCLDTLEVFRIISKLDKTIKLHIFGEGSQYQKMTSFVAQNDLVEQVIFHGFVDEITLNEYYSKSKFMISTSFRESFGIGILEAMSQGVIPFVFDSAKGSSEILEFDPSLVIPNRDCYEMANRIIDLHNQSCDEYRKKVVEIASNYSFNKMENKLITLVGSGKKEFKDSMIRVLEKVYTQSESNLINCLKDVIDNNRKISIVTANPEILMHSQTNNSLAEFLLNEDTLITADGIGVVKAYSKHMSREVEKIPGVDTVQSLLKIANENSYSLFIYGSKQEVLDIFEQKLSADYPNIKITFFLNGYDFSIEEAIEEQVKSKANISLIALGVPTQEQYMSQSIHKITHGIMIGCGGSLDVISGTKKRAPKVVSDMNLEWLYRVVLEPKRLIRLWNNQIKFARIVIKWKKEG